MINYKSMKRAIYQKHVELKKSTLLVANSSHSFFFFFFFLKGKNCGPYLVRDQLLY